jgi:hypothetical protein
MRARLSSRASSGPPTITKVVTISCCAHHHPQAQLAPDSHSTTEQRHP